MFEGAPINKDEAVPGDDEPTAEIVLTDAEREELAEKAREHQDKQEIPIVGQREKEDEQLAA